VNPCVLFAAQTACSIPAMVNHKTIRALALKFPEVTDDSVGGKLAFSVGGKGFAWTYLERVKPKLPRIARPDILAVRCTIDHKEMLIEAEPGTYFDDDHYRGYPAVLVRLAAIDKKTLSSLLQGAWRLLAPKRLLRSL
jgi:hypothetical protein